MEVNLKFLKQFESFFLPAPPPPPPVYQKVWNDITTSPRLNKLFKSISEKLLEYGIKKVVENSDKWDKAIKLFCAQYEASDLPLKEIQEVVDVIFKGIKVGLQK